MKIKNFLIDAAKGAAIGVAMIIPGVSGGTLAVLMNIYDKLISAVSNIFKDFKNSVKTLLPILSGAVLAVVAVYFPLKYALKYAPFPTVMLFAGLMIGSCPKIVKEGIKNGFKKIDILSFTLPLLAVIGICFIPNLGSVDLSASMPAWGYFVLILVGAVASCALVVPGVSGSMLLLIFGYYNSIMVDTVEGLKTDFGHSFLVLALFAIGLVVGFFSIAKLMKYLLAKFPRATNIAIIGFVIGSIPAIFITFDDNFGKYGFVYEVLSAPHIIIGCVLCVLGIIGAYALTEIVVRKTKRQTIAEQDTENTDNENN